MIPAVEIVVCYRAGTMAILEACLSAIERHTKDVEYSVTVLTQTDGLAEAFRICNDRVKLLEASVQGHPVSSRIHGAMLDYYLPDKAEAGKVLTLDSDCLPIADKWLSDLLGMMDAGARLVGILHPWAPPPDNMEKNKMEWRVRSQHCWQTTHVACQMLSVADLKELGAKYNAGDDTGLLIPKAAKAKGWKVDGFKPSRCPKGVVGRIDPEYNRYNCVVYGDRVVHVGGVTRQTALKDNVVWDAEFGWAKERILRDGEAEFLLDEQLSYRYKFDREEEVSAERMQRLFGLKAQRME